jgi:Acetoacetate decarboxylase (ADC)
MPIRFANYPQQEVLITGGKTSLPCFFRKVYYLVALFACDKEKVQSLLKETGLNCTLSWGNKTMVAMGFIQYTDSDLGAYNEIILSIPVVPETIKAPLSSWADLFCNTATRKSGLYIKHIPVTDAFSQTAGQELWGYPKTILPIEHCFKNNSVYTTMFDDDSTKKVLTFSGKKGIGIPSLPIHLLTYSFKKNQLFRTQVKTGGQLFVYPFHQLKLSLSKSENPLIKDLQFLALDGKKPTLVMGAPAFEAAFLKGEEVRP